MTYRSRHSTDQKEHCRYKKGNGYFSSRNIQAVRAEPLDSTFTQSVSGKITKKNFSLKTFSSAKDQKNDQQKKAPDTLIEKQRMYLYKRFIKYHHQIVPHLFGHCAAVDRFQWNLHCKQTVCVLTKGLSVKCISPYTYYLPCQQSYTDSICHLPKRNFTYLTVNKSCQRAAEDPSIYCKSAPTDIDEFCPWLSAERLPRKCKIIQSCTDQPADQ